MKKLIITGAAVGLLALGFAAPAQAKSDKCNWGEATSNAIHNVEGWDQGEHSSNQENPRAGLANVFERGNLHLTCANLT